MNVLTDLFTNYQQNVLFAFIDCIKYSHSLGQNKWGVYLNTPDHLRLIIGGLIVTTIEQGHLWLTLPILGETGYSFFDDLGNWAWESRLEYKVIPCLSGYYWPLKNHDDIWSRITTYHFFYSCIERLYGGMNFSAHALTNFRQNRFDFRGCYLGN